MANKQIFNEAKAKYLKTLGQYVPIVARVHGKNHPEFYIVHELFDAMKQKIKQSGSQLPQLREEFERLRETTDHYAVPGDVCESYEAVYNMLAQLDKAYHASV